MIVRLVLWLLAAGASLGAVAAELREVRVEERDGRYFMHSETWFDAPRAGVFDVLTDYDRFERISSIYTDAYFTDPATDGTVRVHTTVRGCVLFFCQTMSRTERLENEGLALIRATTEPETSDFEYSVATWRLSNEDGGTTVVYEVEMVPSFWVPPVIGPYVMKRKLRKGGAEAIVRIERLAQQSTAGPAEFAARGLAGFTGAKQ